MAGGLRVLAGWRTAGGELGFQAVEDDLDAELEAVVGCRGVVGGGCSEGYVEATAAKFGIPGVAVGVWADGREDYACHGMTSVDNPLPVDRDTLYVMGSVTKTYTATRGKKSACCPATGTSTSSPTAA